MDVASQWEDDGAAYSFIPSYFRSCRERHDGLYGLADDEDYVLLAKLLDEIMVAYPGIEMRHCELDRRYEILEWPLVRCAGDDNERLLADHAVYGERRVTPTATSGQGVPIKFNSPERAQQIHQWLSSVTLADLRRNFDPIKMSEAALYKWHEEDDPDETFQRIVHDFEALKQFYSEVVAHSECVLIKMD